MYSRIEAHLSPNRWLALAVGTLWLPIAALPWTLPQQGPWSALLATAAVLLGARNVATLGLLKTGRAVTGFDLTPHQITLFEASGAAVHGHVCPSSRIWPHLLVLRIIPDRKRRARYLVACDRRPFSNLAPSSLRRAYVLLRHDPPVKEKVANHG